MKDDETLVLIRYRLEQADDGRQFALVTGDLEGVVLLPDIHDLAPENIDDT